MKSQMARKIEQFLKGLKKRTIRVSQTGFIMSQFFINNVIYKVKDDILNLRDETQSEFISINLNQVYKLEIRINKLVLFLDNDIEIRIEMTDKVHL